MSGTDKRTGRVAVVLVLVVMAAMALRGYLPGAPRAPGQAPTDSTLSLVAVVAVSAVALAVLAFAMLTRRTQAPSSVQNLPEALRGSPGELRSKWILVALGVMLGWLLLVVAIARIGAPTDAGGPPGSSSSQRSAPPAAGAPPRPPDSISTADPVLMHYLAATTVVLLVIVAVGTIVQISRRQPPAQFGDTPLRQRPQNPGSTENLARAAELGLVEIGDVSRDPRLAIIACYAAMERGLARAPGAMPLDSDTPSEVLARAVDHHAVSAAGATELVDLFSEARFSPHVMTENHRDSAVAALQRVLADLRGVS